MKKIFIPACIFIITLSACGGQPPKSEVDNGSTGQSVNFPPPANTNSLQNTSADSNRISTAIPPSTTQQSNTSNAKGLNPEHGQPGHRCDIAVGAPLSSPVQQLPQATTVPQSLPPLPQPAGNANGTVRLNPAHGEPGHDCAVQVGQPLKS
jgi:hypothetical protein